MVEMLDDILFFQCYVGKGMVQTFWLNSTMGVETIQPKTPDAIVRRGTLFQANDMLINNSIYLTNEVCKLDRLVRN